MSKLVTFHTMLPACEEGNVEAWRAFLSDYAPIALGLLTVYSPWEPDARLKNWRDALGAMSANDYAAMKGFSHQAEREFLVDLRAFLQDFAATRIEASTDTASPAAPTAETLATLFKGLPLLHQEIAFLAFAGYSQATIEKILRLTPAVASEGLGRLRADYALLLERKDDHCLWPAAWIGICKTARAAEQKDCIPLRQLIRILDGQANWHEKSPAETHRMTCLHCLELWTSLLEMAAWPRMRQPLPAGAMEAMLSAVPCKSDKQKPSLFARMFGK